VVLAVGGVAAVISFLVGAIGTGHPERRLAQLDALVERGSASQRDCDQIVALEQPVQLASRIMAVLLLISSGAMAVDRYL
jgi:hypothetical protein